MKDKTESKIELTFSFISWLLSLSRMVGLEILQQYRSVFGKTE